MKLGKSQLKRLFREVRKKGLSDNQFDTLIESLWRDLFLDAPSNGKIYGRKDAEYVEVAAIDHGDHGLAWNVDELLEYFENIITNEQLFNSDTYLRFPGTGAKQTGVDAGFFGQVSITDDFEYRCVQGGIVGEAIWKKIVLLHT